MWTIILIHSQDNIAFLTKMLSLFYFIVSFSHICILGSRFTAFLSFYSLKAAVQTAESSRKLVTTERFFLIIMYHSGCGPSIFLQILIVKQILIVIK